MKSKEVVELTQLFVSIFSVIVGMIFFGEGIILLD
jgi:hypothetical protein